MSAKRVVLLVDDEQKVLDLMAFRLEMLGHQVITACDGGEALAQAEAMAIFAPNANSYRRLVAGSYAPLAPTWGYENRTVALRLPGGAPEARVTCTTPGSRRRAAWISS